MCVTVHARHRCCNRMPGAYSTFIAFWHLWVRGKAADEKTINNQTKCSNESHNKKWFIQTLLLWETEIDELSIFGAFWLRWHTIFCLRIVYIMISCCSWISKQSKWDFQPNIRMKWKSAINTSHTQSVHTRKMAYLCGPRSFLIKHQLDRSNNRLRAIKNSEKIPNP